MTYWIEQREGRGNVLCVALDEMSEEAKIRCGVEFNPSGDPNINMAKALCVGPMEAAIRMARNAPAMPLCARAAATAATELEKAQMLLVKAVVHETKCR